MVRVRFGIKLGWPFPNAGTFVFRTSRGQFEAISNTVALLKTALEAAGQDKIAARIVCEAS